MLSIEDKENYIKGQGCFCPYCGEDMLEIAGVWASDSDYVTHPVICGCCGKTWNDYYKLTDIIEDDKDAVVLPQSKLEKDLFAAVQSLLGCCELNMDDMEEDTRTTIQDAVDIVTPIEESQVTKK